MNSSDQNSSLRDEIRSLALSMGFAGCDVAKAGPSEHRKFLEKWLAENRHADLSWMGRHLEKRVDPTLLVPGAKSVIVFADSYYDPLGHDGSIVAKYACGADYHRVMKDRIHQVFNVLKKRFPKIQGRVLADSAPVLEHYWAQKSGVGWIGKHSLVITRRSGSYVYLGELVVDLEIQAGVEADLHCGTCRLCLDACPTGAIVEPYVVDAGKCISYLTIEKRGELSEKDSAAVGQHAFGCDICQDVCPWNHKESFLTVKKPADYGRRFDSSELSGCGLDKLPELLDSRDASEFEKKFIETPLTRTGFEGLKRNLQANKKNRYNAS